MQNDSHKLIQGEQLLMKKLIKQCITLVLLLALITTITPIPVPTPGNPNPPIETQGDNDKNPPDTGITNF